MRRTILPKHPPEVGGSGLIWVPVSFGPHFSVAVHPRTLKCGIHRSPKVRSPRLWPHPGEGEGNQQRTRPAHTRPTEWGSVCGGRLGQRVEEQGTWASHTWKHSEADCGQPEDGGVWTAKTVKRPPKQPAQPQDANYSAPLTHKQHILPHPAQPQHTNHWAPRTQEQHQQEHRPQWPTESSDPTQHAKARTGDCPGPVKKQQPDAMSHRGKVGTMLACDQTLPCTNCANCTKPPPPPPLRQQVWRMHQQPTVCWRTKVMQPSCVSMGRLSDERDAHG